MSATHDLAPAMPEWLEPVLDMADIQGIVVPGFLKPHQTLLHIRLGTETIIRFRAFLHGFDAATAAATLADRRAHRGGTKETPTVLRAIGLSYQGLEKLAPSTVKIQSEAFRVGMAARSHLLGDPARPVDWSVGGTGRELDALIVVAGDRRADVTPAAEALARQLSAIGAEVTLQDGDVRADEPGHEHFGFDDGISQPGIRGTASADRHDVITPRHIDPKSDPVAAAMFGYPGQDLVWPGELVIGYPASGPDPLRPGPVADAVPAWTRNGSFLVYRRLQQDVALFWNWVASQVKMLKDSGVDGFDDTAIASRLVGRWPSGAPVNRTPGNDNVEMGDDPLENNDFRLDSDTPAWRFLRDDGGESSGTRFPNQMAKADPVGLVCPWAAHIRKVNTRDSPSDLGGTAATYARRLLRVGVPYGPSLQDRYKDDGADRGLLFLSIQSSIEEQFEFLQARWMNDPTRPKAPGGQDMLVGQNAASADGVRRCIMFLPNVPKPVDLAADRQFVVPRGGGYFFVPSLSALRDVLGSAAAGS